MSQGGFLPPEAAGPEPELGLDPAPQHAPLTGGFAPPMGAAPPSQPNQPWQQQPGWQHQPAPAWAAPPAGPDNGPAVLGFVLALSSIGLLVISAGLSTLLSAGLAIVGMMQGSKGKRLVRDGHTARHKDLAQAGFVIGIVATVLSVLATLLWTGIGIAIAVDEGTRNEFQRQLDDSRGEPAVVTAAALAAIRVIGLLLP